MGGIYVTDRIKRDEGPVCNNCVHWHLITTSSVVGYGNYDGQYKGLCMVTKERKRTLDEDPCTEGKYKRIGSIKKHRDRVLCSDCENWEGSIVKWDGKSGERLGLCRKLGRGTIYDDSCIDGEHGINHRNRGGNNEAEWLETRPQF